MRKRIARFIFWLLEPELERQKAQFAITVSNVIGGKVSGRTLTADHYDHITTRY